MTESSRDRRGPPIESWVAGELRNRLVQAGEKLPTEVRDRVVAQGDHLVPALIDILDDDALQSDDGPGDGYAPLHAVDLLAALKATRATPVMLGWLLELDPLTLLFNKLAYALKSFGRAAFEPVMQASRESDDPEARSVLLDVLSALGHRDEELFEILVGFLRVNPDLAAMYLAEYGDARALPALHETFDGLEMPGDHAGLFSDQAFIEIAQAIEDLGGSLTEAPAQSRPDDGPATGKGRFNACLHGTAPQARASAVEIRPARAQPAVLVRQR